MKNTLYFQNAEKHNEEHSAQNVKTQIHLEEYDLVFNWCKENLSTQSPILDWSALYGHVSHGLFLRAFEKVYAFQYKPSAGSRYSLENIEGVNVIFEDDNPKHIGFEDEFFSAVISCGVLEHVYETGGSFEASMKEMNRILQPNGYFIMSHLPNARGLSEIKSDLMYKWSHPFTFTERGVRYLAGNYGFEVLVFERVGLLPVKIRVFLKRINLQIFAKLFDALVKFFPMKIFANDFFVVLRKVKNI